MASSAARAHAHIPDHGVDGIDDAGVHARLLQRFFPEPALQQAGKAEQQGDEQHDAEQDAGERDAELPDLDAEKYRFEAVADVGAGIAPTAA